MTRAAPHVAAVETHSAVLFFVGEHVYKAKKPVDLGFLDFRTVEGRRLACEREVSLNRRLAPDVYEGVAEVRGTDGEVCEHLVVMARMPDARRLSRCLDDIDVTAAVTEVARQVAELHGASPPAGAMGRVATRDAIRRLWQDGFDIIEPHKGTLVDRSTQERITTLVASYLDRREPLFSERIGSECVRDGHGDLQAEDIFCLDDGPRVLDCLEFDDELRWGDVVADVAFLAMDLERLGRVDLASLFLDEYRQQAGATWPPSLLHLYIAFRAHVRAKVGVIRGLQTDERSGDVEVYQQLALQHLEAGSVRLILVGGLPGTGKSTVARGLAERCGAVVVRSDELRDDIAIGQRYEPSSISLVYDRMFARAEELLGLGHHVVLDATWSDGAHRGAARRLAGAAGARLVEICCLLDADTADRRIETRLVAASDLSEATPAVAHQLAEQFSPWPEATAVHTEGPVSVGVERAVVACDWT